VRFEVLREEACVRLLRDFIADQPKLRQEESGLAE